LYTIKPVAGLVIGLPELLAVNATLGAKKPLSLELISSLAELLGVFVPIPIWA
jgi:hypothetical protein